MQVILEIRQSMLEVLKDAIEAGSNIIYFTDGSTTLAEMQFKELEADVGDAKYKFIAFDDTESLKAAVLVSGRVSEFYIDGVPPGGGSAAVSGSVGGLSSSADIRFNRRDWTESGVITLNNLVLKLLQGTN